MGKTNLALPFFAALAAIAFAPAAPCAATLNETSTLADQWAPSSIPGGEPRFSDAIEDLPLMPGLQPIADDDVLFVAPGSGRIAETVARGTVDVDQVYYFYRNALPQLGWKPVNNRLYQREGEQLRIDARAEGKATTVRFSVKPAGEGK